MSAARTDETHEFALSLALTDLLAAAADFFELQPDLQEFTVERRSDGAWVCLPDGSMHALPRDAETI